MNQLCVIVSGLHEGTQKHVKNPPEILVWRILSESLRTEMSHMHIICRV